MASRVSHHYKLFAEESQRREKEFGSQTKVRQLSVAFAFCGVLYAILKLKQWRATPKHEHVIVDSVIVEIVEDDNAGAWAGPAGALLLFIAVAIAVIKFRHSTAPQTAKASGGLFNEIEQFQGRKDVLQYAEASRASLALSKQNPQLRLNQTAPLVTGIEQTTPLFYGGPQGGPTNGGLGGLRVQYVEPDRGGLGGQKHQPVVVTEMAKLGVLNAERSIAAAKEWLSALCRSIIEDITACNHWFVEKNMSNFDCQHSLDEIFQDPRVAPPTTGFGAAAAPAPKVTKAQALLGLRAQHMAQPCVADSYDVTQQVELRMAVEQLLDTTTTFLMPSRPSPSELQERQQYVMSRLRTFASQRSLQGFRNDRGDPTIWREGYPTDSQLLAHVLKHRHKSLEEHIRLPHQPPGRGGDDLAIILGSSGEPYFYVKHSVGSRTQTFQTRPGQDSLFEAFVFLVAIVKVHHNGCFGSIDSLDLAALGLARIVS